jgi:hypothetical protein
VVLQPYKEHATILMFCAPRSLGAGGWGMYVGHGGARLHCKPPSSPFTTMSAGRLVTAGEPMRMEKCPF